MVKFFLLMVVISVVIRIGLSLVLLQKWLGHALMVDTQRYVELAGAHHEWVSRL